MRRLPALLSTVVLIAALAACTSGGAPGWTYAPAPSATPAASGGGSGEPGASGSPAASSPASVAPSSAGSVAPSGGTGSTLTIKAPAGAATAGFDPKTAEGPANTPFQIIFDNEDNTAPHNLIVQNPDGSNVAVTGDTAFFTGPGQRQYEVPALAAGAYKYLCQVHPTTMLGELTIK